MASSTMSGPLTVTSGIVITGSGLTVTAGGLTVTAGGLTITDGDLTMGQAISQVVPGATSLSFRNNADGADNLILTDAGVATIRAGLAVTAGDITATADDVRALAADRGFEMVNAGVKILSRTTQITAAQTRALAATQISLVPAVASTYNIFLGALLELDFGATGHDDAAGDGNLVIRYTDGSGVAVGFLEADGFVDLGVDGARWVYPTDDVAGAANIPKVPVVNAALVLDNDGAEYTGTGDSVIDIVVYYIQVTSQL